MAQVDEYTKSEQNITSSDTESNSDFDLSDDRPITQDTSDFDFSEFDSLAGDDSAAEENLDFATDSSDENAASDDKSPNESATSEDEDPSENINVQLDLDDAPFLEEEEEEPEVEETEEETQEESEENVKKGRFAGMSKKKKIIILAGALVFLLLIAGAAFFFLTGEPPEPEPLPEDLTFVVTVDEGYKQPPINTVFNTPLEPFWVQIKEGDKTFFLVCTFTLSTENTSLNKEIQSNIPLLRDTIYYYLNTKDFDFLSNYKNFTQIKADLLQEVNEQLGSGELEDILYDNYIVK